MPRADGPVMPSPRAGMAMVRESSSHTTARARIDMPPPPYSVGTSSCQMPSSLARRSKRSRYSGLICSPSVVSRSIGISSLSTKRRSVALRIRSSSGNSKSIAVTLPPPPPPPPPPLPPQHPHVDRNHPRIGSGRVRCFGPPIAGRTVGPHHQRVNFDVIYFCTMVEKETPECERGGFERRAIGGGLSTKAGQTPRQLQAIDHRAHLVGGHRKQA